MSGSGGWGGGCLGDACHLNSSLIVHTATGHFVRLVSWGRVFGVMIEIDGEDFTFCYVGYLCDLKVYEGFRSGYFKR